MSEFATYLPSILLAYSVFLVSIMSPGPNVLAIMGTSMGQGRASGLALAMGVASGSVMWATLTAFGLSAVLTHSAFLLTIIKIIGGVFLFWLAWKSFASAASAYDIDARNFSLKQPHWQTCYFRGMAVQMTNPKAALAWVAIISLGIDESTPGWVTFAIVAGTAILSLVFHVLYALVFSTAPMVRIYGRARRWVQGTLGMFFTFAGLKLLGER